MNLSEFQKEVHELAKSKGFYDKPRRDLESLMLIVSEVSEAAEVLRNPDGTPEQLAKELADVVIRVLDFAEYKGLNIYDAMMTKHNYNKTRPYMHGKKV